MTVPFPRRRLTAALQVAAALAAAVLLVACGGGTSTEDSGQGGQISHVHGLGVNPADNAVYIATHHGLFRIEQGTARLVGEARDDFMGFTVAGPNMFLASGHPAPGAGGPSNVGLIESTDAGTTWHQRSLAGQADFHALDYAHGTVYGYDATAATLRTSTDKTTWDRRARIAAADVVASPADLTSVLASTERGVAASTDGGRSFAPPRSSAVQVFLAWPAMTTLYGVDRAGTLSMSADTGATWTRISAIPGGQPQAFTAVDAHHLLAATTDGIYESRDAGVTFARLLPLATD
ncbi:F510_1955 family glycosylhydrolase [Candidatus Protofrankia californiensis]|uniref:F510_1955 family glycosylhydrolase n=1 Tax=Candidatus Protofrankia californiensis TaxID=1839754 RepID=UPI001040E5E8|nr:exo-alpha-sialidase [Candidatus Protofrankia californiensis]